MCWHFCSIPVSILRNLIKKIGEIHAWEEITILIETSAYALAIPL